MKVVVGIVWTGNQKDYMFPKFHEMVDKCIRPTGVDILWVTDRGTDQFLPQDKHIPIESMYGYVEDICMPARQAIQQYAMDNEYDKMVWQGLDCLYAGVEDFRELLFQSMYLDVIGALTTARANPREPVAGMFVRTPFEITDMQTQFSDRVFRDGRIIQSDNCGTDAIVFDKSCFGIHRVDDHIPWYQRVAEGKNDLTCEGWFLHQLIRAGKEVYLHTGLRTWHCHDVDRIGRRYPDQEKPIEEISW